MPCTSSPLPLQPRYSQLIRQSRAVLHCAPPVLFAIKKERIPCWPRHCVDEWTGWRSEGKEDKEGEKDEDTRDRVVDIVNGRERSRDLENKIVKKFKHFGFIAVMPLTSVSSWFQSHLILNTLYFVSSWLVSFSSSVFLSIFLSSSGTDFSLSVNFSSSSFSLLYQPSSRFYQSFTLVVDQLHGRSYRNVMTRKWNVLSRAVIHLFHLTSPHAAVGTEIAISGHRRRFSQP